MAKLPFVLALATGATGAAGAAGYGALSFFSPEPGFAAGPAVTLTAADRPEYPHDVFEAPSAPGPIVRAIGIYEGGSDHGYGHHSRATVEIEVGDQHGQPLYLALSSYEPVDWQFSGPGVASIRGVYLTGYYRHSAAGVAQGLVFNRSGPEERARDAERAEQLQEGGWDARAIPRPVSCTYTFAQPSGGGCDSAKNLVLAAEEAFRAPLASYFGVYNGKGFRIAERPVVADATPQPSGRSRPNPWSIETGH